MRRLGERMRKSKRSGTVPTASRKESSQCGGQESGCFGQRGAEWLRTESSREPSQGEVVGFGDKWGRSTISWVNTGAHRKGGAVGAGKDLKELGREENTRRAVCCRRMGPKKGWL